MRTVTIAFVLTALSSMLAVHAQTMATYAVSFDGRKGLTTQERDQHQHQHQHGQRQHQHQHQHQDKDQHKHQGQHQHQDKDQRKHQVQHRHQHDPAPAHIPRSRKESAATVLAPAPENADESALPVSFSPFDSAVPIAPYTSLPARGPITQVIISPSGFSPKEVIVAKGGVVTFVVAGSSAQTVTQSAGPSSCTPLPGGFSSKKLAVGATWSYTVPVTAAPKIYFFSASGECSKMVGKMNVIDRPSVPKNVAPVSGVPGPSAAGTVSPAITLGVVALGATFSLMLV